MNTALLNTAELTALHTETLAEDRIARTLANITRRAETLLTTGGYKVETAWKGLYHVHGPQGQHYMVVSDTVLDSHCDCKAFGEYETCKHLQAVEMMLRDEAQAAEYDALYADADDDRYAEL